MSDYALEANDWATADDDAAERAASDAAAEAADQRAFERDMERTDLWGGDEFPW